MPLGEEERRRIEDALSQNAGNAVAQLNAVLEILGFPPIKH